MIVPPIDVTQVNNLTAGSVGLGNVENTALSTWAGTANITTLGTITTGVWSGTEVAVAKGGTGATTAAAARLNIGILESFVVHLGDETTAITAGANKTQWRAPYAFVLTAIYCELKTAQTSGNIFTVDANESGSTILSTKLTIDNTETDSATAVTPPVISDPNLAARAVLSFDVDQIGDGTAKGAIVTIVGYQP